MKLKTKLSKLRHDGHITDAEYSIIINVLNKFATQPTDVVSRDATNEGCWREEEEYFYGLKSKRIWWYGTEDVISRQAAIDVVRKWFDKIQLNGDICLDGIKSLPSLPQPYTESEDKE